MIDLQKPYDDLKILIENTLLEIIQKNKELENDKIVVQELRERQNNEKKQIEEELKHLGMEKAFLGTVRNQQKVKEEELKISETKYVNLQKDQMEFDKKKEQMIKDTEELDKKKKVHEVLEEKYTDMEKREKMIEREKLIDKERKELLDKREEHIKAKEQRLQRLAEL